MSIFVATAGNVLISDTTISPTQVLIQTRASSVLHYTSASRSHGHGATPLNRRNAGLSGSRSLNGQAGRFRHVRFVPIYAFSPVQGDNGCEGFYRQKAEFPALELGRLSSPALSSLPIILSCDFVSPNLNSKMAGGGTDLYNSFTDDYSLDWNGDAGPFIYGGVLLPASTPTTSALSLSNNEPSTPILTTEEIESIVASTTDSVRALVNLALPLGGEDDMVRCLAVMKEVRDALNQREWQLPQDSGPSASPAAANTAEEETSPAIHDPDHQADHTREHSSLFWSVCETPETLVDFAPIPASDICAQTPLPTPSTETPEQLPTPELYAQASLPPLTETSETLPAPALEANASTPAPTPVGNVAGPLPARCSVKIVSEGVLTQAIALGYIGSRSWPQMNGPEATSLAKEKPFSLLYAYDNKPPRPKEHSPFIYHRAEHVKSAPKDRGLKTGKGHKGDNTKKFKEEVWEAGAKDEYLKRKKEGCATPAAESEAEGPTSSQPTTSKDKATSEEGYRPMTVEKRGALLDAVKNGEVLLKGIEDSPLKAFLKTTLESANKKVKDSIKKSDKRAENKAKKEAKEHSEPANVEEGQSTAVPIAQQGGISGDASESAQAKAKTSVTDSSKKRKKAATAGAQAARPSYKKQRGVPARKENPQTAAAQDGGLSSSTTGSYNHQATDYASNVTFGHTLPHGNIPNAAVRTMQHTPGSRQTYAGYGTHSGNVATPGSMYPPLAGGNFTSRRPYPAQPVAGPSRLSQQTNAYPVPPPHVASPHLLEDVPNRPFNFVPPTPVGFNNPFTSDYASPASPTYRNAPTSFSNLPMPAPMGTALNNDYSSTPVAIVQPGNTSLTHHHTTNIAAPIDGYPTYDFSNLDDFGFFA